SWSPDGGSIAFMYWAGGGQEIAVVSLDGSGARDVHPGYYPSWSPDGTQLAFSDGWNLFVVDSSGGEPRQLTDYEVGQDDGISEVSWSPDGAWIAFTDSGAISMVRPDASDPT